MDKQEIIDIAAAMGFSLDYDQFYDPIKEWMRFQLKDSLDEPVLRWIWYKNDSHEENFKRGANILFKAGQKAKTQQLNNYIDL